MDAHWPYDLPRPRLYGPWDKQNWAYNARLAQRSRRQPERVTSREQKALQQLYWRGVETIDVQVGRLLAAVGEETSVLLTADHGEAFGEHGRYFHQLALHNENVNVPFLLRHPQVQGGQVEDKIVRHIDIAPTLLTMVGLPPDQAVPGVELLSAARGKRPLPNLPAISESGRKQSYWLSVRQGDWAAIIHLDRDSMQVKEETLFNIQTDPGETINLAGQHPDKMAVMRAQLLDYIADMRGHKLAMSEISFAGMDDELRHRLESLGYIE
jgi:arylsulfatase A-like enzyme